MWDRYFCIVMLEKTIESPLDYKEIKPVNPKEMNPDCSLEGLMLKQQYFVHLMQSADSLGKTLSWEQRQKDKGVAEDEMVR